MKKDRLKKVISLFLLICTIFSVFPLTSFAGNAADVKSEEGKIIFKTTDTKATSGIRWKTVGFTITKDKCLSGPKANGGDPTKLAHATINLNPAWKFEDPDNDKINVTFTIPKAAVNNALIKAGFGGIKNGETLYLHGIHQVTHDGKNYGGRKYSYSSIRNAEKWANPDDFKDRFDIKVLYEGDVEPIEIQYKTSKGEIITTEKYPGNSKLKPVKPGTNIKLKLDMKKTHNGIEYELYKSYIQYLTLGKPIPDTGLNLSNSTIDKIQNRSIQQRIGGVRFVAIMRGKKEPGEAAGQELIEPDPYGVIAADDRDREKFEVVDGIPTTENLYVNAFTNQYLMGYQYKNIIGSKVYPVNVTKKYRLTWTEEGVDKKGNPTYTNHSETVTVNKELKVERFYNYWEIDNLDVFAIDHAKVNNYALPGESTTMHPKGYNPPNVDFNHSATLEDHIKEPKYNKVLNLGTETVSGGSSKPSVPSEFFQTEANELVPQLEVKNDRLIVNGSVLTQDDFKEVIADEPQEFEIDIEEVEENVLYESGLTIHKDKTNGDYTSSGEVVYKRIAEVNSQFDAMLSYEIAELSNVVIHTPTVCDATILPSKEYNQMLFPDTSYNPLVLDRSFKINITTEGDHSYITGYGYNDYSKYIDRRQVKFPFDVYKDKTYIKAGTWHTLTSDVTTFYMPIWVDEGKYTIDFRSVSINADANNGISRTEELANLDLSNYVATDTTNVEVSGRIYGFNLYDITDYPMWETVFRQPNSTKHTGFFYPVGTKDRNGEDLNLDPKYTLSLVNGSHPTARTLGTIKTGYVTRFTLSTIGNMHDSNDYVRIVPKFYYVDKQGKNRQEVDIYYSETFLNKKQNLVKMGSDKDLLNKKVLRLGDIYRSVPNKEIVTTARIKEMTENQLKGVKKNVFTFTNIMIPEHMRTYIGTDYTPTGKVPDGVDSDKVTKSKQRWYGEYYFPSEIHVAPKGFDVIRYARDHYGIDYKESFWLKNGYIIVNFDIETIHNDKRYLSYINQENASNGYCNMWNMEGYQYEKTDYKGNVFEFIDGDYILYNTDHSAAKDYISAGTH